MPFHKSEYGENFVENQTFLIRRIMLGYALGLVERFCCKGGVGRSEIITRQEKPYKMIMLQRKFI